MVGRETSHIMPVGRFLLTRRELLAGAAVSLPIPSGAANAKYDPRLVANTYIWVQQIQKTGRAPADVWAEAFPAIRRAGYRRVELMAPSLRPPLAGQTASLLGEYGLLLNDIYNGVSLHTPEAAGKSLEESLQVADAARALGTRIFLADLNPKANRERKSGEELANEARYLDEFGRELRSRGMELHLHNHDDPMRDGAREWRYVLRNTDPGLVSFCLDMDWAWNGGEDPFPLLCECGDRLRMLHLRTQRDKVWTEALEDGGDIDWGKAATHLRKLRYDGCLVVELAHRPATVVTRGVEENLRVSRLWAERVFGLSPARP
jgi:sugar phosphate isomerase/epimerase